MNLRSIATIGSIAIFIAGFYFANPGLNLLSEDANPEFKVENISCVGDRVAYTLNNTGNTVFGGSVAVSHQGEVSYSDEIKNLSSGETRRVSHEFYYNFTDEKYNLNLELQNISRSATCNGSKWWKSGWTNRIRLSASDKTPKIFSTNVNLSDVERCSSIRVTGPKHEQTFAHEVNNGCNPSSTLWISSGGFDEYYIYYGNEEVGENSFFLGRGSESNKSVWNYSKDTQTLDVESRHICGVKESGKAICNGKAYRSDSSVTYSQAGVSAKEVAAGINNVCYMSEGGSVYCMGENRTEETQNYYQSDAKHIDSALLHTCILREDGTTECFGQGDFNRTNDYDVGDAVDVSSSKWNTCVLTENGDTDCFGSDLTEMSRDYNEGDAIDLATGVWHTCVLTEKGNVSCYGGDKFGRAEAYTEGDAVDVAAGEVHTCVLKRNGNTECYGSETFGTAWDYTGGDAIDVAAGSDISCVLTTEGEVKCQGGAYPDTKTVLKDIKIPLGSYNTVETTQDGPNTFRGLLQN